MGTDSPPGQRFNLGAIERHEVLCSDSDYNSSLLLLLHVRRREWIYRGFLLPRFARARPVQLIAECHMKLACNDHVICQRAPGEAVWWSRGETGTEGRTGRGE